MLAMEYCVPHQDKYACSTMSSETLSGSCGSRNNRVRIVKMVRPSNGPLPPPTLSCRHGPSLGFSVRGGREHGTGFFVSYVEPGSEAHNQGLRVGDQIIRVNGFTLEDAVHKEVLQLISNHTHLTLKVRSVGMIPVKDKKSDVLSWQIISDNGSSSSRSSPQLSEKVHDVRISIMVAPRSKLGCGICKGPEWKPGIFVQFTKEGGIAREAGLRPGDQILYCNNVDFSDIPFNEAVNLMKTSRQLDLVVRKSAGSELFPGESSGYNSSASSVTGDQSPSWSDSKRLSIVKEENLDLEDRLSHLDRLNKRISNCKKWNTTEWDEETEKPYFKPTIINVSESGTTIKNNGSDGQNFESSKNSGKITDIRMISQQHETKTVIVEVHRSDVDEKTEKNTNSLAKSPSTSSFSSLTSKSSTASVTSSSLSSAICLEIQRRMEKKVTKEEKPSIDEQIQMKKILKGVSTDQQYQHNKLMDEFKKAHQKMFKSPGESPQKDGANSKHNAIGKDTMDRLAHKELSQKLSERLSNLTSNDQQGERLPTSNSRQINVNNPPPPPPPPPLENGTSTPPPPSSSESTPNTRTNTLKPNKTKPKAPPVPIKYSVLSYSQPPPCPTPDYDTLSIISSASNNNNKPSQNSVNDSVEMESLESFRINNPSNVQPKPPSTYFPKRQLGVQLSNGSVSNGSVSKGPVSNGSVSKGLVSNGSISKGPVSNGSVSKGPVSNGSVSKGPVSNGSVSKGLVSNGSIPNGSISTLKKSRPVSVTIGEYPSMRRQPGRLDFLQNGHEDVGNGKEPITTKLATELTQTLNRSNLRKRTESMENLLGSPQIKPQSNGSVRISLSNGLLKNFAKSTSDLTGDLDLDNRIMINVNHDKKCDAPNGILKNGGGGGGNTNTLPLPPTHKPLVQQKSITFGEMPILIKDRPLPVT